MAETSRKKNSIINIITALLSNVLVYFLSLFTSKVIKENLGLQVLGLNGVLSNVISILSLTELGFGSAITFALYKPIANNCIEEVKSLMEYFKKIYRIIAIIITVIGLGLLPFIPAIIGESSFSKGYIAIVYLLFLANSVSSYFFVYKRTLISANQKNYVLTTVSVISLYCLKISQLLIVILTSNYILFLTIQLIVTIASNIAINLLCNKMYPYIKEPAGAIDKETVKSIFEKVKALFLSKIATIIVTSTDNILISMFCGLTITGCYTSYFSIVSMISSFIRLIYDNIKDSVGNFLVNESVENKYNLYKKMFYVNQTLVSVCSICLYFLLTPFITLWLGEDVVLSKWTVMVIVGNFYLSYNRLAVETIRTSAGLFEQLKYSPIIESFLNLVISYLLAMKIGLPGVVLGTVISSILIPFWVHPFVVYKNVFAKDLLFYFKDYLLYSIKFMLIFILLFVISDICNFVPENFISFFIEAAVIFASAMLLWLLLNCYKSEQKVFIKIIFNKIKK